jgi:hypothetical protein
METVYHVGLDVHKRTISYCVKDGSGQVHSQGKSPAARYDLDRWRITLPQPWSAAMEAAKFDTLERDTTLWRGCHLAWCGWSHCRQART